MVVTRFCFLLSWLVPLRLLLMATSCHASPGEAGLDFSGCLFEKPKTLGATLVAIDRESGRVECNGADSARPRQPFTWDWGDGTSNRGSFPQEHVYRRQDRNYVIKVTAHYSGDKSDTVKVLVPFVRLSLLAKHLPLPEDVRTVIPSEMPHLRPSRAPYGVSPSLTVFDDSFFRVCTRETVEYVLTLAAAIQVDLANNDVCKYGGRFEQVLLRDPKFGGMYSIWYTDPICFGVSDFGFTGDIQWSSLYHEMGHNVALNSPAKYHWGFKQDGPANTIYAETIAQIFQHATAYEIVNHRQQYGISEELAFDIARNAMASMGVVRHSYESYRANGCHFCSWNDAATKEDDTFDTFMTVAYKFFEHAERDGNGYRKPVKQLMRFLQQFNPAWEKSFSARENSPQAERFRATLLVAALSRAFDKDLCTDFRELRFPIDDTTFQQLMAFASLQGNRAEPDAPADAEKPRR